MGVKTPGAVSICRDPETVPEPEIVATLGITIVVGSLPTLVTSKSKKIVSLAWIPVVAGVPSTTPAGLIKRPAISATVIVTVLELALKLYQGCWHHYK